MLDACAVADVILSDYQVGDAIGAAECSEDVLVEDDVVGLESVPGEVEEGERAMRVVQYEQWKEIHGAETWCGVEVSKDRERVDWKEAHRESVMTTCHCSVKTFVTLSLLSAIKEKKFLYSHPFIDNSIVSTFAIMLGLYNHTNEFGGPTKASGTHRLAAGW